MFLDLLGFDVEKINELIKMDGGSKVPKWLKDHIKDNNYWSS